MTWVLLNGTWPYVCLRSTSSATSHCGKASALLEKYDISFFMSINDFIKYD